METVSNYIVLQEIGWYFTYPELKENVWTAVFQHQVKLNPPKEQLN